MNEHVEIFTIDEEGILFRAYVQEEYFLYDGDPEDHESPLSVALGLYYLREAPQTFKYKGFDTPGGMLVWQSELATPFAEDDCVDMGERLFLLDAWGERFTDELAYVQLAEGKIPPEWDAFPK